MNNKGFIEETKKILKGTSLNTCKYWKFLDSPEDQENIYHFCMRMYQSLMNSSKDQFLDDDHEGMYSTLLVLEFYKNVKQKPEKWIEQTLKIYQENKPKLLENTKWIIELFLKNSEESQFAFNFLSSLCHINKKFTWMVEPGQQIDEALKEASDYYDVIEFKRKDKPYKKLSHLSYCETIKQSKITALSYCCFLDYLRSSNFQPKKKLWLHVIDILKGLIHSLRHTSKAYELLTVFLHTISNLLKFYGCVYEEILKEMIYFINILRSCPGVNSDSASQLFLIIHQQLKVPGSAFRKQLKRRFVNMDLKKAEDLSSKKYYISFRKISFANPEFCSISNLRKLIIYNVLGCCKVDNINKLWSIVEPLDSDTTYNLYFKIMKILDIAGNLETYQNIHKLIKESILQLFKVGWVPYRKIKKEEEDQLSDLIISENTQKFFQFPTFEIVHVKPENIMNKQYEYSMNSLFDDNAQYPYNQFFFSRFLEFIFLGNDEQLSRILQLICDFLITIPPNEYQKLAFYLIPTREGDCFLTEYISCKDLWYRRFVYNVFKERTLFPVVSLDDAEVKDTFPSYLYNKTIQMYVREAQRKIPFQIFSCDMQFGENMEPKTIYFINHILMGASLECEGFRNQVKREKKNSYTDGMEIYLQKVKRISPIGVDVTVRYKEPGGNEMVISEEKFLSIEDLQICNTPRPYFFGYKPNPLDQYLQLSILTTQSGKIFRNELQTRQNFKRHTDNEIAEAFRDLFMNMTIESVVLARSEGMKENLKLLIDGTQIPGIKTAKISPVFTNSKLPLTLPVRCFLPFEA